jgi:hypothetical protein
VQPAKNLDNCIGESGKESISWMPRQTWTDSGFARRRRRLNWEILEFRAESFQRLFSPPRREESDPAFQTA